MCAEMLEAQRQWLPEFDGKSIAPRPQIHIPAGCQAVDVPLDPALAIGKRFGTKETPSFINGILDQVARHVRA